MYDPKEIKALARMLADMQQKDKDRILTGDDITDQKLYLSLWLKEPQSIVDNCIKIFNRTFEE